ncbi:MAG: acetyl-CoA carboxylase biotin carboxyl carrier protein [Crocinitomicaceae bacterium]|nr:acetyl-CoA carboxylase biotin carboxyl carrier protein [Crocinitomicaceae bacterium]
MNLNEIQDLIKLVSKMNISEVELEKKDFKITIKSECAKSKGAANEQQIIVQAAAPQAQVVAQPQVAAAPAPAPAPEENSNLIEVKSPMIGTFYRSTAPDKDPFVNVGSVIKSGDPICIIEAMKLFNEIEAEVSGKIVKVLVDDAKPVEYDQPLFLVDPS